MRTTAEAGTKTASRGSASTQRRPKVPGRTSFWTPWRRTLTSWVREAASTSATISETVAICRYFEGLHPAPPMFGKTPLEQAMVEQWVRRVEFAVMTPVGMFWRHAHPFTAAVVVPQYKDFGESNRAHYERALGWLDGELKGREFLATGDYTVADLSLIHI